MLHAKHATAAVLVVLGIAGRSVAADGPDIAKVLALKPVQADVVYDTPPIEVWEKCKLEVLKKPNSGWILRDHRGLVIRKFIDTTNDNVVDRWSYYMNGQEVYRDVDTNNNGKADQYFWYNTGGSRWGVDPDEDGKINAWKVISAEEAAEEAVAALASRDFNRMRLVLLNDDDMKTMGLGPESSARIKTVHQEAPAKFQQSALNRQAQLTRFDGHNPVSVPASDVGGAKDIVAYSNATILAEVAGQTQWLRVPEIVKVGDTWKLTDVPSLIDPNKNVPGVSVLVPTPDELVVDIAQQSSEKSMLEEGEEIQQFAAELQKLDAKVPGDGRDPRALANYHVKRAELCAHIGAKSRKLQNREHWYKQTADSLNAAVQTNEYNQGINTLNQYSDQFLKTNWGNNLAAYFKYRAINSKYATELHDPSGNHAKAQEGFLASLKQFIADHPQSEDAADALWQLGNGTEFSGSDDGAVDYYQQLVKDFPNSPASAKASGALRRIESKGRPLQLVGGALGMPGNKIDAAQFRGKVLVVAYWATWCEPCKSEIPKLAALRQKYAAQGFEVLGVSLDANGDNAVNFVKSNRIPWPQMHEEGSMDSMPAVQYGIISLPYMMLVDADGRVLNKNLQSSNLESEVEKAMAKQIATRKN